MLKHPPYYAAHEPEYVKRLAAGHVAWDAGAYDEFHMRPFVLRMLERSGLPGESRAALVLGCGTGPLACLLAERGFTVTALDVSASAITFARQEAARRLLHVNFQVCDVCRWTFPAGAFHLIVDDHLLHCLVRREHRRHVLTGIADALAEGGEFWSEMMALTPAVEPDPAWHLDADCVTWARCADDAAYDGVTVVGNTRWLPIRRIDAPDDLLAEIELAGLTSVEHEIEEPDRAHMPAKLRVRVRGR